MQEHRHSGARALPASPESRNTDRRNQCLGLCSWVPDPALTGRPGMTREFFSTLLVAKIKRMMPKLDPHPPSPAGRVPPLPRCGRGA
jgi:hypothetical protein